MMGSAELDMSMSSPGRTKSDTSYIFVFLEIFSCEGGIQSYVKDVLAAYLKQPQPPPTDIFLLRDRPTDPNPFACSGLQFHYMASPLAIVGRIRLALALGWLIWRQRPSRIICGHILLGKLVYRLCQWFQLPYTVMTYGKEVWYPLETGDQRVLQEADQIWTISRYSRERICVANGVSPQKIHLMPCVVNGQTFTPGPPDPELLQHYGLSGNKVLMTVARLWSGDIYKGVDVTIRALPTILAQIPQVKYLIIGRGDDQPRLAQLTHDLGVAEQVVFAGFVASDRLVEHYRLADAYVMPSQEGFGIVYLEAMACGVPVLSGDQDGSADPLQDGRLGWRVPYRDPEAVAAACLEMLGGVDPRCHGAGLRRETLAHFSPAALAQRLGQTLAPASKTAIVPEAELE
jgi:glycosyltransferase involved in cell wall biosynthesis